VIAALIRRVYHLGSCVSPDTSRPLLLSKFSKSFITSSRERTPRPPPLASGNHQPLHWPWQFPQFVCQVDHLPSPEKDTVSYKFEVAFLSGDGKEILSHLAAAF